MEKAKDKKSGNQVKNYNISLFAQKEYKFALHISCKVAFEVTQRKITYKCLNWLHFLLSLAQIYTHFKWSNSSSYTSTISLSLESLTLPSCNLTHITSTLKSIHHSTLVLYSVLLPSHISSVSLALFLCVLYTCSRVFQMFEWLSWPLVKLDKVNWAQMDKSQVTLQTRESEKRKKTNQRKRRKAH